MQYTVQLHYFCFRFIIWISLYLGVHPIYNPDVATCAPFKLNTNDFKLTILKNVYFFKIRRNASPCIIT
jgi:hypothetical protein